jgi:hypothetical protein
MELKTTSLPAGVKISGEESGIVIAAGKSFKIETSPQGEDILDVEVPAGKQWTVVVSVSIDEVDV